MWPAQRVKPFSNFFKPFQKLHVCLTNCTCSISWHTPYDPCSCRPPASWSSSATAKTSWSAGPSRSSLPAQVPNPPDGTVITKDEVSMISKHGYYEPYLLTYLRAAQQSHQQRQNDNLLHESPHGVQMELNVPYQCGFH